MFEPWWGKFCFFSWKACFRLSKTSLAPEYLKTEESFYSEVAKLWFDVHVHDRRALALMVDVFGSERLVFGTNFAGWDQGKLGEIGDLGSLLTKNAKKLLRI